MRRTAFSLIAALAAATATWASPAGFQVTSPDFADGGRIPGEFTCDGKNTAPTLEIAGAPAGTKALALIVEDPDAPSGTFTHWLIWNIPPGTKALTGGAVPDGAAQGTNDFGNVGYSGPCPPSGTHRYFFRLYALAASLGLKPGASRAEVDKALSGQVIGKAVLMGRYARGW